ncbi:hypothetical protein MPF19_15910 [Polaribacter sp. Z014]|uniref:DUF4870 domain-containing protein n=1 Tax=Polaribacter sp. Z014 TaxID=2927126 RepID=UPI002021B9C2|nr:hypothetical protein [Polaribacter sp. Z014]MCL7764910.1 hypothetical protein [Polaribacter sp. Z014]
MENQTVNEGKTIAIISYITFIGTIVAYFMNNTKKNTFASFHIRQMIGLALLGLINQYAITAINGTIGLIIAVALFVLWIIGIIGAFKGEEKAVPVIGDQFQEWFKNV